MPKAREIKKRIRGVANIQEITRAMKLVAAARIKKAENRVLACRPYTKKIKDIMAELLTCTEEKISHELMTQRDIKRVAFVPVSGDKGLCGSFNSNIFRYADKLMENFKDKEILIIPVGNKSYKYYSKRFNISLSYSHLSNIDYSICREMSQKLISMYLNNEFDEIYFIYGKFVSMMSQVATEFKFLPIVREDENVKNDDYIVEPSIEGMLNHIIPKYLEVQVYQIILESIASEIGSRLMAMSNATDNAEELIRELTLRFYRARQEAITTEIIEVTSGSQAIKG